MEFGATFSHYYLNGMGLDIFQALTSFMTLGLKWVRLGCYWNLMEKIPGKYDYSLLNKIIDFCSIKNVKIVLTVGIKQPRWPEFFWPQWIREKLNITGKVIHIAEDYLYKNSIKFIRNCVNNYHKLRAIKVWQIENEPLDPSGIYGYSFSRDFLESELKAVRSIDQTRPVMVTVWGNDLKSRGIYKTAAGMADIVGLDIYPMQPVKKLFTTIFRGPDDHSGMANIVRGIKKSGVRLWISELQTEPWEPNGSVSLNPNPPSFRVEDFIRNFNLISPFRADVVMLWGFEYWYYRKCLGDTAYMDQAKSLIRYYG